MPRVDIKHLLAKGPNKKLVDQVIAYVQLMLQQGKPCHRVIVQPLQYEAMMKLARGHDSRAVLCCGDALVYYNHEPIDESAPEYKPRPRFDARLPAVAANPFGVAVPAPVANVPAIEDVDWDSYDDDIPF